MNLIYNHCGAFSYLHTGQLALMIRGQQGATDMNVELEAKCTITHEWGTVAKFFSAVEAGYAARALSKLSNSTYRTSDYRWPEEGVNVTVYTSGEIAA
jgi:hypothetical protein